MLRYLDFISADKEKMARTYGCDVESLSGILRLTNLSRSFIALLIVKSAIILPSGSLIMDGWAKLFTVPLLFVTIACLMATCHLFEGGQQMLGRLSLASLISTVCIVSVIFCGGFIGSQATPILLFPMVLALCILPLSYARWFFAATFMVPLFVDLCLRSANYALPDFSATTSPASIGLNVMLTLAVAVYFCVAHLREKPVSSADVVAGE